VPRSKRGSTRPAFRPLGATRRAMACASLAAGLCLLPLARAGTPPPSSDRPTVRWREGPVRYIITVEEEREFIQLRTDEARGRFIERFWFRRDPQPRTLLNEYRLEFWRRVAGSNRLFTESSKPGWKTDMGRYYILLGPPDDRDTTLELAPGLGRTGVRGAITWAYHHAPNARMGTGLKLVFTKDPSGEYRAETDPRLVQEVLDNTITLPLPSLNDFGIPLPQLPSRLTEMQLMLDLGRLEEVPQEVDLLTEIVSAEEFFGVIPFSTRYDFFAGADRATLVAVTLNIHPDPLDPPQRPFVPDYLIVGRIDQERPEEGGSPARSVTPAAFLHESDFSPDPHNDDSGNRGPYLYQTVVSLRPGRYRLSVAVFDRARRKTGSYVDTLEVPAFDDERLSLSSLCLSADIGQVPGDGAPQPYVIGHLKVTPRLIPAYRNGETFAVYYQVYSALTDPSTRAPNLQIEYQFQVNQGGSYIPIGRAIRFDSVGNTAQGWSFPLRDWPAADFRLRVTVTDALTGQVASREVAFKVL